MSGDHNMYASGNQPAFPRVVEQPNGYMKAVEGMTLRDYFAAKAMQVLMAEKDGDGDDNPGSPTWDGYQVAEIAYEFADAMLKVRGE